MTCSVQLFDKIMSTNTFDQEDVDNAAQMPDSDPPGDTWCGVYFDTSIEGRPTEPGTYDGRSVNVRHRVFSDHKGIARRMPKTSITCTATL